MEKIKNKVKEENKAKEENLTFVPKINDYIIAALQNRKLNRIQYNDENRIIHYKDYLMAKENKTYYYELSMIYNRLGIVYSDVNEMQKTIDYFLLAINTYKKTESNEHIDILDPYYSNLVNAYEDTEEYELAIHTLNKKIELIDVIYNGKEITDYLIAKTDALFDLAHEYRTIEDDLNSKKVIEDIIELLENNMEVKSIVLMDKLASAYDEYGNLLSGSSDDDVLAISYFAKAKEIFKQLLKYNSKYAISVLYTNNSIAYCYQYISEPDKAEKYYLESLELIDKYKKKYDFYDEFTHAIVLRGLALLYDQLEDIEKAEYYYLNAIKLFENLAKENDDYSINSLKSLYTNVIKFYDHIMNEENVKKYQDKLDKLNARKSKN